MGVYDCKEYAERLLQKKIDGLDVIYTENHSIDFEKDGLLVSIQYIGGKWEDFVEIYKDLKVLE